MQTDINHYVTKDRLKNASFRQKPDPISNNILRRQNILELVFEDISMFDTENPIVGSLLREIDIGKKDVASDLKKKAPGPPGLGFTIQNRLNKLKERNETGGSNNLSLPPSPPPSSFLLPPPAPPPSFLGSNQYVPSPQPPPPTNYNFQFPPPPPSPTFPSTDQLFGSHVMTKEVKEEEKEKVLDEIDGKINELPDLPKLGISY